MRRGYHQREHTRVNEQGTSFRAGQGSALLMQQRQPTTLAPTVSVAHPKVVSLMSDTRLAMPQNRIQLTAKYKIGQELTRFCVDEEYLDGLKMANDLHWWMVDLVLPNVSMETPKIHWDEAELEYDKARKAGDKDKMRQILRKEFEEFWEDRPYQHVMYEHEERLINALEDFDIEDGEWEVYDPQKGKATKPMNIDFGDLLYEDSKLMPGTFYKIVYYRLTRDGFAISFQKEANDKPYWLYFMKSTPGHLRDWLHGGFLT